MIFKTISTVLLSALLVMGTLQGCSSDSKTDDATITQNVQSKIANEPSVASQNILVETRDGVVILTGTVDDKTQETAVITLSQSVEGVKNVDSRIVIKPAPLIAPKPQAQPVPQPQPAQPAPQAQQPAAPQAPTANIPQPEQPTIPPQTPEQPVVPTQPQTPNVMIQPAPQGDTQTGTHNPPATTDTQKQDSQSQSPQPQPQSTTY